MYCDRFCNNARTVGCCKPHQTRHCLAGSFVPFLLHPIRAVRGKRKSRELLQALPPPNIGTMRNHNQTHSHFFDHTHKRQFSILTLFDHHIYLFLYNLTYTYTLANRFLSMAANRTLLLAAPKLWAPFIIISLTLPLPSFLPLLLFLIPHSPLLLFLLLLNQCKQP